MSDRLVEWAQASLEGRGGREVECRCPWCGKPRKLYLNPEKGAFVCFSCGKRGSASRLVKYVSGEEAAARVLRARAPSLDDLLEGLRLVTRDETVRTFPLPRGFVACWSPDGWSVPDWIEDRGFSDRALRENGVGWGDGGPYDGFMITPIVESGVRAFVGRRMGDAEPRFRVPSGSGLRGTLVTTEDRGSDPVVLVEGLSDSWRVGDVGHSALASLGKGADPEVVLAAADGRRIVVAYDADASGEAHRLGVAIEAAGGQVTVAKFPPGEDPDSLGRQDPEALRSVLAEGELPDPLADWADFLGSPFP